MCVRLRSGPRGDVHYHTLPAPGCLFTDVDGQHSLLFGIMVDGIPIYGNLGDGGLAPSDLDECMGHVDATHPFCE